MKQKITTIENHPIININNCTINFNFKKIPKQNLFINYLCDSEI